MSDLPHTCRMMDHRREVRSGRFQLTGGCARRTLLAVAIGLAVAPITQGREHVTFRRDGQTQSISGRLLVEAQDGGVLVESPDGVYWAVQPDEIVSRRQDDEPFAYLNSEDLAKAVLAELPAGFRVHQTAHYVICYNTSTAYAHWCGSLFERLYRGFYNFWEKGGLPLQDAPPLVAIVFHDRASYTAYGKTELGEAADAIIGYYSFTTNRIATYDLTGVDRLGQSRGRSSKHIDRILSRPEAERTVATVIHEATHQLAFNSGLQTRFADIPLWLSEGLAIFFESPDLSTNKGWRTIGAVNRVRLQQFANYAPRRPENSLLTLLLDDGRFRQPAQADDAYAESWALCYYLIRYRRDDFVTYLQRLREKPPLATEGPEQRLRDFHAAFGQDLSQLDEAMRRALRRAR